MADRLKVAIAAARLGAKVGLKYFGKNLPHKIKSDNTPVTKADVESEEVIKKYILSHFPNDKFVGEEYGGNLKEDTFWLIDPIDGTKNFIRSLPFWAVEIALVIKGEVVLGVSFSPVINELLYAQKGSGTFLNGKRTSVSKISTLSDAFLNHGTVTYFKEEIPHLLKLFEKVNRERGYGDFYGYHLVATGKADIMLDAKNAPWDIAAAKIIVEEAGGRFTNFQGKEWSLSDATAIATNGLVHDEVLRIVNGK